MPIISSAGRTRSVKSIRRSNKRGRSSKRSKPRSRGRGRPSAFEEFNSYKRDAERSGAGSFEFNGRRYARHTWNNGVVVWRRRSR